MIISSHSYKLHLFLRRRITASSTTLPFLFIVICGSPGHWSSFTHFHYSSSLWHQRRWPHQNLNSDWSPQTRGGGSVSLDEVREWHGHIYTLPNVKQIASGKQPHGTGRFAWCFVSTKRGGIGRVGGRRKTEEKWGYMYMYSWFMLLYSRN